MTTKDICKVQYLSCVEAYFGAWIKDYIELPALYAESFIPWNDILRAFQDPSTNYANFSCIPRIQDFAERIGIVTHRKEQGIPQSRKKDELVLVSVKENFFSKQKPWRRDHYIAVEELTSKKLKYLNEYPLESGELSIKEFMSKFDGDSLIFSLHSAELNNIVKSNSLQLNTPNNLQLNCDTVLPVERLRDAIGILRVSRRRTLEWITLHEVMSGNQSMVGLKEILSEQIRKADKYFLSLHSVLIRGNKMEKSELINIARDISITDDKIYQKGFGGL